MSQLTTQLGVCQIEWPKLSNRCFIPVDCLENLVTPDNVARELQLLYTSMSNDRIKSYADRICNSPKTNKKIFGILFWGFYGARRQYIKPFIDEGITDDDLPFCRATLDKATPTNPFNIPFKLCVKAHQHCELTDHMKCGIKALEDWEQRAVGDLGDIQWTVQAPIFDKSKEEIPHLDLDPNVVMPFIEDREFEPGQVKRGGFSEVWPVQIHSAHQSLFKPAGNPVIVSLCIQE